MNSIIHADIFFFISTIALIFISIGVIVALIYIIIILRRVSNVSKKVEKESDGIIEDIRELRGTIRKEGMPLRMISTFFMRMFSRRKSSKKSE